jgi:hypothetical protein
LPVIPARWGPLPAYIYIEKYDGNVLVHVWNGEEDAMTIRLKRRSETDMSVSKRSMLEPEVEDSLSPEAQKMVDWFFKTYERPEESTPYCSAEGGFMFIHGGPYEPREELQEKFDDASDELLKEAADYILAASDDCDAWAPREGGEKLPDRRL